MRIERTISGLRDASAGLELLTETLNGREHRGEMSSDPIAELGTAVVAVANVAERFADRVNAAAPLREVNALKAAALYLAVDLQELADQLMRLGMS